DAKAAAAAFRQQRRQQFAIVVAGDGLVHEANVVLGAEFAAGVARIENDEARLVVFEVPLDERQRPFADRAEADHDDGSVDRGVDGPVGHGALLEGEGRKTTRSHCRDWAWRQPVAAGMTSAAGAPSIEAGVVVFSPEIP